ncbi:phosphotransferase enzyme family protein [Nocardia thailandica]
MTAGDRVFGMGDEPVTESSWPASTDAEIARAVGTAWGAAPAEVLWRSPRPLSTTVGVALADGGHVVVKRLPTALRDRAALREEHRFANHLRAAGVPVPELRVGGVATLDTARGPVEFVYEVQSAGAGEDRYRPDFSWSPWRDTGDAAGSGAALARAHLAAAGFDAPARPARPLVASLHEGDPAGEFAWHLARRPALAAFLAGRDWRRELPPEPVDLAGLRPLWTHGDWHPTNQLWRGHEVSTVFDFGLADRTTAVFDLATTVERTAVDWLAIRAGEPAEVRYDQLAAFFEAYLALRPPSAAERRALPRLLPVAHLGYELSEIDYFLTVVHDRRAAEIAYEDWLLGHLRWYATPEGRDLREFVRGLVAG